MGARQRGGFTKMRSMLNVSKAVSAAALFSITISANAQQPDRDSATAVLSSYKSAIERLDITDVDKLFTSDAVIIESGKVEGNFAAYRDDHLGPELKEFKSFAFDNYKDLRLASSVKSKLLRIFIGDIFAKMIILNHDFNGKCMTSQGFLRSTIHLALL